MASRQLTSESIDKIKRWEAKGGVAVLSAYQDSAGIWTIGYGTTNGVVPGMRITERKAELMLLDDLDSACAVVESSVRVDLSDNQFGALVSLVYNIGAGAFRSSTLLRKLNAGDYNAVPAEFMRWNKITDPATGKKRALPGLTNRRAAEVGLWSSGEHVASATANVASPQKSVAAVARTPEVVGSLVGGGAGIAAVASALNDSASQIGAVSDGSEFYKILILLFVLAGMFATIIGVVRKSRA